jgi:cytochrome c551/c552
MKNNFKLTGVLIAVFFAGSTFAAEPVMDKTAAGSEKPVKNAVKDCSKPDARCNKKEVAVKPVAAKKTDAVPAPSKTEQAASAVRAAEPAVRAAAVSSVPAAPACDTLPAASVIADGVQLATLSGCTGCHKIGAAGGFGPDWKEVAAHYRCDNKPGQIAIGSEARLISKVAHGGSGAWGSKKMPANSPRVSDANIKKLVDFILTLH